MSSLKGFDHVCYCSPSVETLGLDMLSPSGDDTAGTAPRDSERTWPSELQFTRSTDSANTEPEGLPTHLAHSAQDDRAVLIHAVGTALQGAGQDRGEPC
jgi:hypothetical protein